MSHDSVEKIAKACHQINRLYCQALGDHSQPPWTDAPQWQRDSAIAGVRAVLDGSAATPEAQHASWLARKQADGWTYGEEKDSEAKTHPCMVPYDDLPASQQAKDAIFRAVVRGLSDLIPGQDD